MPDLGALKTALTAAGFRAALDRQKLTVAAGDGDLRIAAKDGWMQFDGPVTDGQLWIALEVIRRHVTETGG